jgi:hypothetical protein
MKAAKYDEKDVRTHVKKLVDILETPCILVSKTQTEEEPAAPAQEVVEAPKEGEEAKQPAPGEEKWKKSYDQFFEAIKKDNENRDMSQQKDNFSI